jgi:hypothetical protein
MQTVPALTIYALSTLPGHLIAALETALQPSWSVERELTADPIALGGPHGDRAVLVLDLGAFIAPSAEPRDLGQTARVAGARVAQLNATLVATLFALAPCYQSAAALTAAYPGSLETTWPLALTLALLLPGPHSVEQQALFPAGLSTDELRAALQSLTTFSDFPRLPPPGFATVWPSAAASTIQPPRFAYDPRQARWKHRRDR